jgi:O-antigen ligase
VTLGTTWERLQAFGAQRLDAPIVIDAAILAAYVVVRTVGSRVGEGAWLIAAMGVALWRPGSGLGMAAAVALFPQHVRAGVTPAVALIVASGIGVAAQRVLGPFKLDTDQRPIPRAVALVEAGAIAVGAATYLALIHTAHRFPSAFVVSATLRWTELAAGLALLVLGLRAFQLGSARPLVIALAAVGVALFVALIDTLAPTVITGTPFAWLVSNAESSRATGSFFSPNRLGTVAAVAAVVAATQLGVGSSTRRALSGAVALLASLVLLLTFSRGAILGLVAAGAALVAVRSRRAALVYVAVAAVAAVLIVPILVGARLAGSGGTLGGLLENDAGRFDAWLAGIRMIAREPFLGQGFDAFAVLGPQYGATDGLETAHNELIDLWAQAGVLAAAGFTAIVIGLIRGALDRWPDPWAMATLGAVVVFVVASSFNVQAPFLAVTTPIWIVAAYGVTGRAVPGEQTPNPEPVDSQRSRGSRRDAVIPLKPKHPDAAV